MNIRKRKMLKQKLAAPVVVLPPVVEVVESLPVVVEAPIEAQEVESEQEVVEEVEELVAATRARKQRKPTIKK
jgi:hypothetical protein